MRCGAKKEPDPNKERIITAVSSPKYKYMISVSDCLCIVVLLSLFQCLLLWLLDQGLKFQSGLCRAADTGILVGYGSKVLKPVFESVIS